MVLAIYLSHVSFYSSSHACWDKTGLYIHVIAGAIAFILLPIVNIVLIAIDLNDSYESAYGPAFVMLGVVNICLIINGLTFIRKAVMETIEWYKARHSQGLEVNNAFKMAPYN